MINTIKEFYSTNTELLGYIITPKAKKIGTAIILFLIIYKML